MIRIRAALGIILIAVFIISNAFASNNDEKALVEIKIQAQPIIEALDRYYADNGYYPYALKELEPKYLYKIPDITQQLSYGSDNKVIGPEKCVKKRDEARAQMKEIDSGATLCFKRYRAEHQDTRTSYPLSDLRKYCPEEYPPDYDNLKKLGDYNACVIGYRDFQLSINIRSGLISTPEAYYISTKKSWGIRYLK